MAFIEVKGNLYNTEFFASVEFERSAEGRSIALIRWPDGSQRVIVDAEEFQERLSSALQEDIDAQHRRAE
ncbi:MAG TPA: hypothetical protein PL105_13690 [Caldilineaceae bacterium]|nr:hypothetical protein [Caldilineaceae bacterium]